VVNDIGSTTVTKTGDAQAETRFTSAFSSGKLKELNDIQHFYPTEFDSHIYGPLTPTSVTQESKLRFCGAESNVQSDTGYHEDSTEIFTNVHTHEFFCITTSSPTQSEETAITSWDEWDQPSDMLSHIDPIIVSRK
jgi:hypothetical protein